MTNVHDPLQSSIMKAVRGKDTRPEIIVRRAAHRLGLRFRLHAKGLPGRPDIVLPRWRAVVFVHGCFWHRHAGCRKASMPKSNVAFWAGKFEANVARDARDRQRLEDLGWRPVVVWECECRTVEAAGATLRRHGLVGVRHGPDRE